MKRIIKYAHKGSLPVSDARIRSGGILNMHNAAVTFGENKILHYVQTNIQ